MWRSSGLAGSPKVESVQDGFLVRDGEHPASLFAQGGEHSCQFFRPSWRVPRLAGLQDVESISDSLFARRGEHPR